MHQLLKTSVSVLALTLGLAGCATSPFAPPAKTAKPASKAPVVDRSSRPAYPSPPALSPQVDIGQLPREDPLTPREYAEAYPDPTYPTERYPSAPAYPGERYPNGAGYPPAAPSYPNGAGYPPAAPSYPSRADYPPASGGAYQPPAQPPGAAYAAAPSAPPKPPVAPPRPTPPTPAQESVALAQPPAAAPAPPAPPEVPPETPVAPRPASPPQPAELPPAEITREGNQAVVALLESADKYVKGGQLDKAGAALERALRIEPRNAGIWHDLAQIRLHQGQYQQAESLASKSNNLASGNRALQSRNWKLISVARKAGGNTAGAEEAEAQAGLLAR